MNRQSEYQQEMDSLRFTQDQKDRMTEAVLTAAGSGRRRRPYGKTALIAACLAVTLAVGAGASDALKSAVDVFSPLFGGAVAQTEIIDRIGRPIGASDSDHGVTVTADAIMGDPYNVVIIYTFSRDDGEPFLPEGTEARVLTVESSSGFHWMNGGAHGVSGFFDADPDDNAVQYYEQISAVVSESADGASALVQGSVTADFRNIEWFDQEAGMSVPLYKGHWRVRYEAAYEDMSVQLAQGETFTQGDITFTIHNLTLSPLGIHVGYTADTEAVWSASDSGKSDPDDERTVGKLLEKVELFVTKTDGTVVEVDCGGSLMPENGVTNCTKSGIFDMLIPLEDMASVTFGGVCYPVEAE